MIRHLKRSFIALIGSLVVIVGIVMIPYPGPGWLVVFAGLGILATEFDWAKRLLDYAKGKYDAWVEWLAGRGVAVQSLVLLATTIVVVVTVWLMNGYGVINDWFAWKQEWLRSPLFRH
jgi:uncharacterized protein (TIGR02611 family)